MEDGLPSDFVYRVIQDQEGFIWACTNNGIAKFDGYEFKVFNASNGLIHSDVWNLEMDKDHKMWISTFDELAYIKNDSIFFIAKPDDFKAEGVYKHVFLNDRHFVLFIKNKTAFLEIVDDNAIILQRHDASKIYDYEEGGNFAIGKLSENKKTFNIAFYKNDTLFQEKIIRKFFNKSRNLYSERIDGKYLIIGRDSIFILENNRQNSYSNLEYLGIDQIETIRRFEDIFYIQSKGKVYLKDIHLQSINDYKFLQKKLINSFYQDHEGNFWVSSTEGLRYYLNGYSDHEIYEIPDISDNYKSIIYTPDEDILLSTRKGNLHKFVQGQKLELSYFSGLPWLNTIAFNEEANLTFALDRLTGVFPVKFYEKTIWDEDNSFDLHANPDNVAYNKRSFFKCNVKDIAFSKNKNFVIAHSFGVSLFRKNKIYNVCNERSYALSFLEENLWVGTTKGIKVFDKDLESQMHFLDSIFIKDITKDAKDNLWITTDGAGLWKYENGEINQIKETRDLTINKIVFDEDQTIWLACLEGLLKIKQNGDLLTVESFNESDGVISRNIIDLLIAKDKVYVLGPNELSVFNKEQKVTKKNSTFNFEGLYANGIKQSDLNLSHKNNNIEIFFKTKSYTDLAKLKYLWNLEGLDEHWRSTKNISVRFNRLPPGDYTFKLKTFDAKDRLLNSNNTLSFSIKKAWYQTWLFYLITGLIIFGSIFYINQRRFKLEQKKAEEKAKIQKQFYELEMKAIQAQMNPHFIFNALNSIQNYIYNKEPEVANDYLVDFSKLMRLILESTHNNFVKLESEIELITLYVTLERMRFQNKFDFNIIHDDISEIGSYTIPSNLVQPFVENAINHGIANKKESSNLTIQFMVKDEYLFCKIEDDGIGREKARQLKKEHHVSRAMTILKQRQQLMQVKDQMKMDFEIFDLRGEDGKPNGTRVIVKIPLK